MLHNKNKKAQLIVGIGASAGGLEALKRFFNSVPPDASLSFIVVQHLDPNHESILAKILQRDTSFSFCQATDQQKIEPGCAYIIPPNQFIEVEGRTITLTEQGTQRGSRLAVDTLFRSLARSCRSQAVGIVLSGAGSDGTAGLRAIKAAGGLALVQSPQSADYPSMPQSAISAGVVDEALPIEKIPDLLFEYATHPYHELEDNEESPFSQDLTKIKALLKAQENFDLSQYKESTVKRRLYRRMSLTNKTNPKDYLTALRESIEERQALMRDLLINVTDFFRDREAFEELDSRVLANIVEEAEPGTDIRVWVAGCASGEEAYTLAILLSEQIEHSGKELDLRIFATDIDAEAIQIARRGVYPVNVISELPAQFVEKYFSTGSDEYATVKSNIRDCISFAQQNVYTDPPFSRLHLVSCRNLLIYLQRAAQQKVLKSFFYSLLPEGYLFLGSSETVSEQKELFSQLSSKWRIFCRKERDDFKQHRSALPSFFNNRGDKSAAQAKQTAKSTGQNEWAKDTLLQSVRPSIIVDEQNCIVYFHGNVNMFLQLPDEGQAVLDLYTMLSPKIRTRMRSAIYKARKSGQRVSVNLPESDLPAQGSSHFRSIISPTGSGDKGDGNVVITFETLSSEQSEQTESTDSVNHRDQDSMIDAMEKELRETKEELQNTVEELETSTEELKAAHEEALSTNEELQSSNEELEASTEELRSLNEELTLVNSQLKDKINELSTAHDDIKNFFASTNLATLFVSSDLRVKRFTPAAERLLRIGSQDIEQPLATLHRDLIGDDTLEEAQRVLNSLESSESEIAAGDKWFTRKILPYQTEARQVDGVVITFIDITKLKTTANRLQASSEQHAVIAKLGMKALSTDNVENLIDQLVREVTHTLHADFCKVLEYRAPTDDLLVKAGIGWDSGVVGHATVPATNASQAGYTLYATEPVIVEELGADQRFSGTTLLNEHNVTSGISCVIEIGDKPYGVIGVHTVDKRRFSQADVHFLVSAANILSVALHRKDIELQLRTNENRLRVAKDSSHMGSFEWDIQTGETYWDKMLYDIWGITGDTVTQDDFINAVHADDRAIVQKQIELAQEPGGDGHYHSIYRVIHPHTQKITWVEANGQVINGPGDASKMIGMVLDITRQRELEASLKNAVKELQEADENKNEFLATLGHEIRNPLASISAATQIMEFDNSKLDWALKTMKSNVKLVSSLLDELLDLTRISKGEVRLEKSSVDINTLLEEVVQNFSSSVEKNNQSLRLSLPSQKVVSYIDRVRIQQAINNIISNASKFTPEDGLIDVELIVNHDNSIVIQVTDSGIGLDMQYQEKVFEPFQQINEKGPRKNDGLGIGLSLVKQIAELHGGSVSIFSEGENCGTRLSMFLPFSSAPDVSNDIASEHTSADTPLHFHGLKKLRVMMVDDNETVSDGLAMILNLKGCEVAVYNTGSDALAHFEEFSPNVALLDIGLPDMSGIDLIKALKPRLSDQTLFLAITGYGHLEARRNTKAAGFDGHLNKPVQLDTILAELERFAESLTE